MAFGEVLAELRKDNDMYQKDLANYLSVSVGTISNYEKGVHQPDLETFCKIADFFKVSSDYLLERTSFRYDMNILSSKLDSKTAVSDIANAVVELSPSGKEHLLKYLEMLTTYEKNMNSKKK